MDLICPVCGESWALDSLHDVEGLTYTEAARKFRTEGCGVLFDGRPCVPANSARTALAASVYELLGDDMDGAASEFDDMAFLGAFDQGGD